MSPLIRDEGERADEREREPVDIQVGACLPTRAPLQLQTIDIEIFINFHPYKSGEAAAFFSSSESWYLTLSPHKVHCFRNPGDQSRHGC